MQKGLAEYRVNPKVTVLENSHDAVDYFQGTMSEVKLEKIGSLWGMRIDSEFIAFPIYVVNVDDEEYYMGNKCFFKKFTMVENIR